MEMWQLVLIVIAVFLVVRILAYSVLKGVIRRKMFERSYLHVLHSPEFKVKGKFE